MSKYQKKLNCAELELRLAAAVAPDERRRWQVLVYIANGMPPARIATLTGYRPRSVRQIVQRYVKYGAESLVDQRTLAQGAVPLLSAHEQLALWQVLQNPPEDGGVWTGPKVAAWMAAKTGKPVHRQRGWEYLRRWQRSQSEDENS